MATLYHSRLEEGRKEKGRVEERGGKRERGKERGREEGRGGGREIRTMIPLMHNMIAVMKVTLAKIF